MTTENGKAPTSTAWHKLQLALRQNDPRELRAAVLGLDPGEREALSMRLGEHVVERLLRNARRARAGKAKGRVVVLNGIMGALLDIVESDGDTDRVWVDYWDLFNGHIADLELGPDGRTLPGRPRIAVGGLFPDYAALVQELGLNWRVLPFPFDWRVDMDQSADRLAEAVRSWAGGEPVHIVAHSMGGLVARRMTQRHPDLWRAMDDPEKRGRGGRLVMLGTPNRGSFAISLVFTAEEGMVKKLAFLDRKHDKRELVELMRGFAGAYQMLPSPDLELGDDRQKLFDAGAWGEWPVVQGMIDLGKRFQQQMAEVVTPERLLYVAGYGQETPHRIRIKKPGAFEYKGTRSGDGRVPHELGRLDGVRTFFVEEKHGDLPKNDDVLDGISDLLEFGTTSAIESQPRSLERSAQPAEWQSAEAFVQVEEEFEGLARRARGAKKERPLPLAEAERLAALLTSEFIGTSRAPAPRAERPSKKERKPPPPSLNVDVTCADITKVEADVYAVGHYVNVLPQNAERALDDVVSPPGSGEDGKILRSLTRRRVLRGEVGETHFYRWYDDPKKHVAVAGMGHPGSFGRGALRRLAHNLASEIAVRPDVRTVATVLIGSGAGNLGVEEATRSLMWGLFDAAEGVPRTTRIARLRIVERAPDKAAKILKTLQTLADEPGLKERVRLIVAPKIVREAGAGKGRAERKEGPEPEREPAPRRVSWTRDDRVLRASALASAVISERSLRVDSVLLDELVEHMTDPEHDQVPKLASLLGRLVVPRDFRELLRESDSALVLELDRYCAGVHWEMLALSARPEEGELPLALQYPLARQLRTEYSPAPDSEPEPRPGLRALVVGDPGDPREGDDLPGARAEALEVVRLLEDRGVEVTALIGAPSVKRVGELRPYQAAARLEVLDLLTSGGFDILHYCGHGDFDRDDPTLTGWVFEGGLLTSGELELMDRAPRLVVANACLSGLASNRLQRGKRSSDVHSEADLLPGLADEFFHRGVRNYIGTAWEVDDQGAIEFARVFYQKLLPTPTENGDTIGNALLEARKVLHARSERYDALWAAYQHYGDPLERIGRATAGEEPPRERSGARVAGRALIPARRTSADATADGSRDGKASRRRARRRSRGRVGRSR